MSAVSSGPVSSEPGRPPRVSVITATRNDMYGLERTAISVVAQLGDFELEHIVVDGAASPDSVEILEAVGSAARLIAEPDAGRHDAMNKGVRAATGDVLWFLDSGDAFGSAYAVDFALGTMSDNRRAEWGFGMYRVPGRVLGAVPASATARTLGAVLPHQSAYFGADLVARIGDRDPSQPTVADQLFVMTAAELAQPKRSYQLLCDLRSNRSGRIRSLRRLWALRSARPMTDRPPLPAPRSVVDVAAPVPAGPPFGWRGDLLPIGTDGDRAGLR